MTDDKKAALERRIKAAEERAAQLKARKRKMEAQERAREAGAKKRRETRQRILLGAFLLHAFKGKQLSDIARLKVGEASLDGFLSRPDDRELFGLPPEKTK